jgi:hypothetical protein
VVEAEDGAAADPVPAFGLLAIAGYMRHVGCGVLSYNLHVNRRELLVRERGQSEPLRFAA